MEDGKQVNSLGFLEIYNNKLICVGKLIGRRRRIYFPKNALKASHYNTIIIILQKIL